MAKNERGVVCKLSLRCGKNLSCIERPQAITHHTRLLRNLVKRHAKLARQHETTHQIERRTTSKNSSAITTACAASSPPPSALTQLNADVGRAHEGRRGGVAARAAPEQARELGREREASQKTRCQRSSGRRAARATTRRCSLATRPPPAAHYH